MHTDKFGKEIKVGDYIFGATEYTGAGNLFYVTKVYPSGIRGAYTYYKTDSWLGQVYTSGIMKTPKGFVVLDPSMVPEDLRYVLEQG